MKKRITTPLRLQFHLFAALQSMITALLLLFPLGILGRNVTTSRSWLTPPRSCSDVVDLLFEIREDAVNIREEASAIREEAYRTRDDSLSSRVEFEAMLLTAFSLVKDSMISSNIFIHEIKSSLTSISGKMSHLEERITSLENKQDEENTKIAATVDELKEITKGTKTEVSTIRTRQKTWMSEVRLISLHKIVEQNNPNPGYANMILTDGNIVDTAHTHTLNKSSGNKMWIKLGGYFRIHRVFIYNYRGCCQEQLTGTHIYADNQELIGAVVTTANYHEFIVPEVNPIYSTTITLLQPLAQNLHLIELQVWGAGPFEEEDVFA